MTKGQALQNFFSGFGINAYPVTSVPDNALFPWLTYEQGIGCAGEQVSITARLWYHTESESVPNAKAEQIGEYIGRSGVIVPYTGGVIWVKRGTPWCLATNGENDNSIKTRTLNIELEYLV